MNTERNRSRKNREMSDDEWAGRARKRFSKEVRRNRRRRINDTLRDIASGKDVDIEEWDELEED